MRARNIKPGFFKNEDLAECDPLARILYAGLWWMADWGGGMEFRPKRIKAETLPYDECNIDDLLSQLHKSGFVLIYQVNGEKYLSIVKFAKHQNCHVREAESTIPVPEEHSTSTVQVPEEHSTSTVQVPEEHGSSPAESPLLNPEFPLLNPEGGVGETESKTLPPVDNPKNTKEEFLEEPKKQSTSYGERWTDKQGDELDQLLQEIAERFGKRYHQQCYLFTQEHFNKGNPSAILFCLKSLLTRKKEGEPITMPKAWLDKAFFDQDGKHNAREFEARAAEFKGVPTEKGMTLIGDIFRGAARASP